MASHVFVIDSSFKRTQIKVTPGKSLREVLEEACQSRKLSPEGYTLKTTNNKTVDLSQPFRLSGLSAGAKLQLTQGSRSPGVVSVALQLPESEGSGRLTDKFASTTSLWLILRKFEDAVAGATTKQLNLTQRGAPSSDSGAGRMLYEQPCLHAVGRNFETFTDLQKTLAQLGLNGGSALLRLSFKKTSQPLEEAMTEISTYFTTVDSTSEAPRTKPPVTTETTVNPTETPAEPPSDVQADVAQSMVIDTQVVSEGALQPTNSKQPDGENTNTLVDSTDAPSQSQPVQPATASTQISVYLPPSSSTPAAARQPDDPTVFEPTIDHAKAHQAELNRASRPQRLLSDKELAEQEAQRQQTLATIRNVVVRVRYPDQSQIETTISASESAADMYARVAETIAASDNEPFELRYTATTGAKAHHQVLPRSASANLVRDCGFRGKMMLTFVWAPNASAQARKGPSLKEQFRQQAVDLKVDLGSSQADDGAKASSSRVQAGASKDDDKEGNSASGSGKRVDVEAKMKRFLGLGKK